MDVSPASQPVVRTVEVAPPSARAETWNVLRVAALIVLATWIYLADSAAGRRAAGGEGGAGPSGAAAAAAGGGADARDLMPYQRLFRTLGGDDQRMFRELQEGLLEAENARSSTRRWPRPAALAAQGIPPFAPEPAARGGRRSYRWELRQEGPYVNYLGTPADRRDPELLLLVQEPDPPAPPAGPASAAGPPPQPTDEMHHRLADGTLLHVSTWMRGPAAAPGAVEPAGGAIVEPYAKGWTQLLAGPPRR
jgi:hypothetical protein